MKETALQHKHFPKKKKTHLFINSAFMMPMLSCRMFMMLTFSCGNESVMTVDEWMLFLPVHTGSSVWSWLVLLHDYDYHWHPSVLFPPFKVRVNAACLAQVRTRAESRIMATESDQGKRPHQNRRGSRRSAARGNQKEKKNTCRCGRSQLRTGQIYEGEAREEEEPNTTRAHTRGWSRGLQETTEHFI